MIDVSAFVNTGSSPTLGKDSVLKTLGLDENKQSVKSYTQWPTHSSKSKAKCLQQIWS